MCRRRRRCRCHGAQELQLDRRLREAREQKDFALSDPDKRVRDDHYLVRSGRDSHCCINSVGSPACVGPVRLAWMARLSWGAGLVVVIG
jgi:hypothetical protein